MSLKSKKRDVSLAVGYGRRTKFVRAKCSATAEGESALKVRHCSVSVALPQIKQTQKTNNQTKKTWNLTSVVKPKKGALLKIDLPWMTVCMPQKTDVAVSVALPMNFAFFYDATIMTF